VRWTVSVLVLEAASVSGAVGNVVTDGLVE
jgi:hypothetical protein